MTQLNGRNLGQYQILRELGRGGMAIVYEAYQPSLGRNVAIKVLPPEFTYDKTFVQRFLHEARAAARLNHPNIVAIYDVGEQNGVYFIVMQKLEGESLHSLIQRAQGLPMARAAHLVGQVAAGLDYAHAQGLVHRDIKPANIFVGPDDHATVMDFGIAKALAGAQLTQSGMMMGTPAYMSPEQASGKPAGPGSDVYSLGLVLYQMLAGQTPFQAESTPALLYKQVHEPPPPLRSFVSDLPPAVEAVVSQALAKDPVHRFRSAGEMARALQAAVARRPAPPKPVSSRYNRVLPWGGMAAGLVLVALIVALLARERSSPEAPAAAPLLAGQVETPGQVAPTMPTQRPTLVATSTQAQAPPPTDTPPPRATDTPAPTPEPVGQVTSDQLNVRVGAGAIFPSLGKLAAGETVQLLGRNDVGDWLWVKTADGLQGWVATQYIEPELSLAQVAVVATPAPPACTTGVDPSLARAYDQGELGCAQGSALVTWSAWQPFEQGGMLWLEHGDQVYVLMDGDGWREMPDKWNGEPAPYHGDPPAGLQSPVRGFGWLWGSHDEIRGQLGWATDQEKGICTEVQFFERGLIFASTTVECGQFNRAKEPGFGRLLFGLYGDGMWRRY